MNFDTKYNHGDELFWEDEQREIHCGEVTAIRTYAPSPDRVLTDYTLLELRDNAPRYYGQSEGNLFTSEEELIRTGRKWSHIVEAKQPKPQPQPQA